ncbi:MAG: DNA-binding GntR family transcriptional regulator [Mariniblastus sp.]|jgi:DNA-binding GntR family transcriptional regulator
MQLSPNEKSYRGIRAKLESGLLGPGDKLITRTLAEEFGVSLSPVREAINRLASEGIVTHTPGAGAEVKHLSLEDLNELYVLRDAIESCAAGLAAASMTPDDWEQLEFIIAKQDNLAIELAESKTQSGSQRAASKEQMLNWIRLEEQFHETIVRCSRNKMMAKLVRDQRTISRIFESHLDHGDLLTHENAKSTIAGKRELLAVFRTRDVERASAIMSQQIKIGRRHVIGLLREKGIQ